MDAYKCLALGAKAVSVGRHLMPLLKNGRSSESHQARLDGRVVTDEGAANGADAVAGRINEMTAELAGIMARTGVSALDKMDATVIHRRAF